jgi:pSer/pThr/pTyr-binding forkhead associated (FHA) protein
MKIRLVALTQGELQGQIIPISLSAFVIGRGRHSNLQLVSPFISRRHCALFVRGAQIFVEDFASRNGTFVNGARIQGQLELRSGDHLHVGPLEFQLQVEESQELSTPRPNQESDVSCEPEWRIVARKSGPSTLAGGQDFGS